MTASKKNSTKWIQWVLFLIIFLSCSFSVKRDIVPSSLVIALWIGIFVFLLFQSKGRIHLSSQHGILAVVLIASFLLSSLVNQDDLLATVKVAVAIVIVFLFSTIVSFSTFKEAYCKVMQFLCVISLIILFGYYIAPGLFRALPKYQNEYVSFGVMTIDLSNHRNYGLFWEPGAYQTFVAIALIFEINDYTKLRIKQVIVYMLTLITTFSTTGYISLILILAFILLRNDKADKKLKLIIMPLIVLASVFFYFNQDLLFGNRGWAVFGKVQLFLRSENYRSSNLNYSSTGVRYFAIVKPLEAFFKKPILGWGYEGLQKVTYEFTHGMNTCTFVNWFAVYGIVFGTVMLFGINNLTKYLSDKWIIRIYILMLLFIITISENYVNNPVFVLFALNGCKFRKNGTVITVSQNTHSI